MNQNSSEGARARRGAGDEPKRKRARVAPLPKGHPSDPEPAPPTLRAFNSRVAKPSTTEEAVRLQSDAALRRAVGRTMIDEDGDHTGGRFELAEAEAMEAAAASFMDVGTHVTGPVQPGNGGEVIVATKDAWASIPGVIDTIRQSPGMLAASASRQRMELTGNALTIATDAAESIQPRNSLEKMLAHQMAACHRLGMLFAEQAATLVCRPGTLNQFQSVEASRLANAAARMMGAFQDGFLALDRARRGGKQTVKVIHQHVAVGPGGQAVVTGSVKTGGLKGRGNNQNGR